MIKNEPHLAVWPNAAGGPVRDTLHVEHPTIRLLLFLLLLLLLLAT